MIDGFLIIDKPSGMTSHYVVNIVRKKFNMRRIGHAGTLDPLATGVLIVLIGRSTKLFDQFSSFPKAYEATMTLGAVTDTADSNGRVIAQYPYEGITVAQVEEALGRFVGDIQQVPPMVSALKVKGERLYRLARRGIEVNREPRMVRVDVLRLVDFSPPHVKFYIECSKGTYIRKIAEDIGGVLGCGAFISQIRRMKVGPFLITDAVGLDAISEKVVRHWRAAQIRERH